MYKLAEEKEKGKARGGNVKEQNEITSDRYIGRIKKMLLRMTILSVV